MKRIITAETIRQMVHEGKKQLEVNFTECLITPEVRVHRRRPPPCAP